MGGVSVGGDSGGKKSVDHEIPLIPFIDFLIVTVMFLLVTAVWNRLARIEANQQQPGQQAPQDAPPPEEKVKLILQVQGTGFVLAAPPSDAEAVAALVRMITRSRSKSLLALVGRSSKASSR